MDAGGTLARYLFKFILWIAKYLLTFTGLIIPLTIFLFDIIPDDKLDVHFIIYILSLIVAIYIFTKNLYHFFKFK